MCIRVFKAEVVKLVSLIKQADTQQEEIIEWSKKFGIDAQKGGKKRGKK